MVGILIAGIAPGIALLYYFYLKDKYEPEPINLVIRTFLFGAILVFPISFVDQIFDKEYLFHSNFSKAFFRTGFLEESLKWIVLYYCAYLHKEFDEPFDGIVYGSAVALGFATAENILYTFVYGTQTALIRSLLPVSSHALFGVIMGYYISKVKFSLGNKGKWIILSLLVPIILHGLYDYILLIQTSWLTMMLPFMFFLWWFAMAKLNFAQGLSKQYFDKLSQKG
ncbi:glutamic-type intramembrane protease PrsW [Neobacillus sp. PS3-34]|uniref:glutamic-type intramembrane protease PrsW n=1 Tax=Neobacillus sp. PS3-34 TaxID=3070678 RepID=UPI0027E1E0B1|nr:glutamic-type intramembrane protease PrsW [Neobacillus sp. PS3-34]WML48987.1 glutamic-type intramembrane protease PrsW [Neobacillus sp. PS3-34]